MVCKQFNFIRMRVITSRRFVEFAKVYPDCKGQLELINKELKNALFENLNQVKDTYPNVSILKNNRVVLNVHGNKYRLILKFNFRAGIAFVRFIGTHAEYDKIDANTI